MLQYAIEESTITGCVSPLFRLLRSADTESRGQIITQRRLEQESCMYGLRLAL